MFELVTLGIAVLALVALHFLWKRHRALQGREREHFESLEALREKFRPVTDLEAEAKRVQAQIEGLRSALAEEEADAARRRDELSTQYSTARETFGRLKRELALVEESLEDVSFGLYSPHFDYDTSEKFKLAINRVRAKQKEMVRSGRAGYTPVDWVVGGSKRDGARMARQYLKVMLRAFNGECDAALAKVNWNNVTRMEARIEKAFTAINKLGTVMSISIDAAYLVLKIEELRLHHEMAEKKKLELDEQREIRAQMREEEKAAREIEKAKKDAEAEEQQFLRALERAKQELGAATGEKLAAAQAKAAELERQLAEAHARTERAISRAQMTRSGHVYLISNIGSFGKGVLKIGMTRRLEPLDRVKELSDASVPFSFDVHGMVFVEDAPALENALHNEFADRRVNLVNRRKEFFQVDLDEVAAFLEVQGLELELTLLAEAREYRETLAMRAEEGSRGHEVDKPTDRPEELPERLF